MRHVFEKQVHQTHWVFIVFILVSKQKKTNDNVVKFQKKWFVVKNTMDLEKKKIEYDNRLHEEYIINPNETNIDFDEDIQKVMIPSDLIRGKTFLNRSPTYLLILLLKEENIFYKNLDIKLIHKVTRALTGFSEKQLPKLYKLCDNDFRKLVTEEDQAKVEKIHQDLVDILKRVNRLKYKPIPKS